MSEESVTVTTLKYHTHDGAEHEVGDTYTVDASQVGNLVAQGLISAPYAAPAPPAESHPVTPITTDEFRS